MHLPQYIHELRLVDIKAACIEAGGNCHICMFRHCEKPEVTSGKFRSYNCIFSSAQEGQLELVKPMSWPIDETCTLTVFDRTEICRNIRWFGNEGEYTCQQCPHPLFYTKVERSRNVNGTNYVYTTWYPVCAFSDPYDWFCSMWFPDKDPNSRALLKLTPVEVRQFFKDLEWRTTPDTSFFGPKRLQEVE